ncbi:MAG: UDP-N-acetylmuramoyl-L-alanyl-D-glutamate--2,6-diaminopimelate ligase [Alphaproteobacteria bacterium]|nr:UDP-N-acetylmuramoyl-L-alanyl-D-glutamate--2,6-diaminopimelate ligase [Alphaproteobacteria bacterium]
MNTAELLKLSGIEVVGTLPEVTGIALKADEVKKGFIFVALKGTQKDGADFVPEAVQNGAALVLAEHGVEANVPVIVVPELRQKVSVLSSLMYPSKDLIKVAVTGTNGKTSTVFYVQQLLNAVGIKAASLGTIGVDMGDQHRGGSMTTPDAVTLNKVLHDLEKEGVRVVAMEASSHGLDQGRLKGLAFAAGAFTNLTQDHLDYHRTMEAYLTAKEKLFSEYGTKGGVAVLNADVPEFERLKKTAEACGERVISYGKNGQELKLKIQKPCTDGQEITFEVFGKQYTLKIRIVGDFQVMNLFAALGLCVGAGAKIEELIPLLEKLKAPAGRIELMGSLPNGAQVFVDYAHTPDAVERVLISLKEHTQGKLVCLMGCGGDRDKLKRPLMGAAAAKYADVVYVTDDNPRSENPADIRRAILEACPAANEYDNREIAIHEAIHNLKEGDVLAILGKGHEAGQTIKGITFAMDDRVEAKLALLNETQKPVWSAEDLTLALSVKVPRRIAAYGLSIDTRTLKLGDLFIALNGEKADGHAYVKKAVELGAAVCLVAHLVDGVPADKQIVVSNTMEALETLARYRRMRCDAVIIGVTGSSGKTTTKEMIKACLSGQGITHATQGNFNNQIGVPLTLATMPDETRYAVVEMGMNHAGELMHLSNLVRPDVTIITSIGAAHREFFPTEQDVARAKSEIFDCQNRQGTAVLKRTDKFYDFLKQAAEAQGIQHLVSFGENAKADWCLNQAEPTETGMMVKCTHGEKQYDFRLAFWGKHFAEDALGALAVVEAVGGNIPKAIEALKKMLPAEGRGLSIEVKIQDKTITIIDDAYNANPSSMRASIEALGLRPAKRKVAVLGDMLELGDLAESMHAGLREVLVQSGIEKVYLVGSLMQALWNKLPPDLKGAITPTAVEMVPILKRELLNGDVVLVKASHGTGLGIIIRELKGK